MADVRRLPGPNADLWEWQLRGACRGEDSDLFFHPEGERGPARAAREAAAKAVCGRCPVVEECRRHALATREPYGVWGGMSESERETLLSAPSTGRQARAPADRPPTLPAPAPADEGARCGRPRQGTAATATY